MRIAATMRLALILGFTCAPLVADAQVGDVPARELAPVVVQRLCSELEAWFAAEAAGHTAWARAGGVNATRAYLEAVYSDSSALVLKGSGDWMFFSRGALIDSIARAPSDTTPDRFFEFRPVATSVGLLTSRRALFVQRYLEIDSADVAMGMTRVYSGMKAGTVVRTPTGWRVLERVNTTGSLGTIDSATARVRPWQCR